MVDKSIGSVNIKIEMAMPGMILAETVKDDAGDIVLPLESELTDASIF